MKLGTFKKLIFLGSVAIVGFVSLPAPDALAQRRDFHGRDFRRFSRDERRLWLGGRWIHDYHFGRLGWWWVADGTWYFYPRPVYPFPDYVPSTDFVDDGPPPPAFGGPPPPPYGGPPPVENAPPPPVSNWYYCDNPQGYYPYVPRCNGPWKEVPTTPPPPPPR